MRLNAVLGLVVLAGCSKQIYERDNVTPEELEAHYGPICVEDGEKEGSASYAKCIQGKFDDDREEAAAKTPLIQPHSGIESGAEIENGASD